MKKNKKALSLVIAISIALIMSLLALYILEYMIPFSKNTKNIEQSVSAYYQADSAIEDALLNDSNDSLNPSIPRDYSILINGSGTVLPPVGNGNSEFDKNYNIIRIGEPIQLEIGKGQDKTYSQMGFKFKFKAPDIDSDTSTTEILSGTSADKIINWQISGDDDILNASGSQINVTEINGSELDFKDRNGRKLDDLEETIEQFYNTNCKSVGSGCILKMSVMNKLEGTIGGNNTIFPYLEWKINTDEKIKLRYKIIDTTGKSYGFQKDLKIKVPQQTLNEAFDFTVFQ